MQRQSKQPRLPPRARYFFDKFAQACVPNGPRAAEDWKRFYRFIHAAHQRRLGWTAAKVAVLLSSNGFDHRNVSMLAFVYAHGRALLRARPAMNYIKLKAS
jgi:hypothetical protein